MYQGLRRLCTGLALLAVSYAPLSAVANPPEKLGIEKQQPKVEEIVSALKSEDITKITLFPSRDGGYTVRVNARALSYDVVVSGDVPLRDGRCRVALYDLDSIRSVPMSSCHNIITRGVNIAEKYVEKTTRFALDSKNGLAITNWNRGDELPFFSFKTPQFRAEITMETSDELQYRVVLESDYSSVSADDMTPKIFRRLSFIDIGLNR
ncbi:TPA: hypothetical protein HA278_04470, partial [Candidatus Woesearchaeota archaeon]|nr:hypothetical protein [Candidatus Woesearchaeota archaeon]